MRSAFSHLGIALLVVIGTGCGSGFGGCGTLKPLPTGLTPFGVPNEQVIEGGVQARMTESGLKKFSSVIENLLKTQINGSLGCIVDKNSFYDLRPLLQEYFIACPNVQAACGHAACGGAVVFRSEDRPAPWNIADGKDGAKLEVADGTNPIVNVDLAFDLRVAGDLEFRSGIFGINLGSCTIALQSEHWAGDSTTNNFHLTAPIQLSIDPVTGKLKLNTLPITVLSLGLTLNANGCGSIVDAFASVVSGFFSFFDSSVGNVLLNLATTVLQPQIDAFVQGLLPDPLGIAGTVDTGALFVKYDAPKAAGLEMYLVPGGYVAAKDRGLTLGVLAGMNSDWDPSTRGPGKSSEADPCVPSREPINLAAAPWNLPANALRKDFTLNAAASFAGMPDPVDASGNVRDLLIGISRTYFDLIGFHLFNSGTLCLHVDGASIKQLSTGTLGVLAPSLAHIALDPKAPVQLVLRPQTAVAFTLGDGSAQDPLLHVAINDLRIDMYAWVEERWVRILTVALDLNLGMNLTVTKDANMLPVIQPMLSQISSQNLTVRITNSDLLAETPAALEPLVSSLIALAGSSLGGSIPTVALPSVSGFALDDMSVQRVQSGQDDFLGLFATIKTPATSAPLLDWSDPQHPRMAGEVRTKVSITKLTVPGPEQLRAIFDPASTVTPARPELQLALSADGADGHALEYAWKIDDGMWREWTQDAHPIIDDDAFLLQGHHKITVRARVVGDYHTEDSQPVTLPLLIDSTLPELHPALDPQSGPNGSNHVLLRGWDLVSDADHLTYSYLDENGEASAWQPIDFLDVATIGRITNNAAKQLVVSVKDEAGLIGTISVDATAFGHGDWGKILPPKAGGCSCEIGGASTGLDRMSGLRVSVLALLGFLGLLLRRRRRVLASLAMIVGLAMLAVGCGCDRKDQQCTVNDDCVLMKCDIGKIPACSANMCICTPDLPAGETGRYASMTIIGDNVYVAAYNQTYGDLMVGSVPGTGRVTNWAFVDGVPDEVPGTVGSHVRGGVSTPGMDVGKYTSITRTLSNEPIIAYHDQTNSSLKFASFGALRWHSHTVDVGGPSIEGGGDDIGAWASLTVDKEGKPGIVYSAIVHGNTTSGKAEGQLRYAQASVVDPQSPTDWTITVVDSRPLPGVSADEDVLLPYSIAVMVSSARKSNGSLGVAYYDRERGNLRYAEQGTNGAWTHVILDGEASDGTNTADVGQYPSLTFDSVDVGHISYVDASQDNLLYVDTKDRVPVVVDDGYRNMDEMTNDGLPSPVFHLVGDSSSIKLAQDKVVIAYQDSTTGELRLALRDATMKWTTQRIAGHDDPFKGSYGFWAAAQVAGKGTYVGSYAINQHAKPADYFVEIFFVDLGLQQ